MLSAADGGIYYQTFADSEVNHEVDIGRNLVYAVEETTGLARRPAMYPAAPTTVMPAQPTSKARPLVMPMAARSISTSAYIKKWKITTVFRLEKINADHTQRTCLADDLPFGWVQPIGHGGG